MKPKTMVLMAVAVVCGLGASYMTSRLLAERKDEVPQEVEKVKVLVAKKNVPQGTYIKEPTDWFVEKEFTLGEEPKKAVRTFDELKDKVVSKPLSTEQWVIADDLLRKDQVGMQRVLPKGMRALTIKVSVDTVVGGFVQPNSRVDVINTVGAADEKAYSQTILQNMLVLAVDTLDQRDIEKKAIISSNVTLAVTPDEAQTLALAQKMGELRLILRNEEDQEKITIRTLKPEDIRTGRINKGGKGSGNTEEEDGSKQPLGIKLPEVTDQPSTQPEPPPEPIKPKKPWRLTLINSGDVTKVDFLEEDNEFQTQIKKTDAVESKPSKKPAVPGAEGEKSSAPSGTSATPAPAPEKPAPGKKPAGSQ
jgi:pilus assembly protein CpaB